MPCRGGAAGVWPILPMAVTNVFINFRSRQNVMESAGESAASFPAQFGTSSATKCYGKRGGFGGVISSPFRTYNVNELLRINITPPGRREGEKQNVRNLGGEMGRRACFVPASSSASWSSALSSTSSSWSSLPLLPPSPLPLLLLFCCLRLVAAPDVQNP